MASQYEFAYSRKCPLKKMASFRIALKEVSLRYEKRFSFTQTEEFKAAFTLIDESFVDLCIAQVAQGLRRRVWLSSRIV